MKPGQGTFAAALACALSLIAPAAAAGSVVEKTGDGVLRIGAVGTERNEIEIRYSPTAALFFISDGAGVEPGGPECVAASKTAVLCGDRRGQVKRISVVTGAGDDTLAVENRAGAVPARIAVVARGGSGKDVFAGGLGKDRLFGGRGADVLGGREGRDRLFGGPGSDGVIGFSGNDRLFGGDGVDALFGLGGADVLKGGGRSDVLLGAGGADALIGGGGADTLRGDRGRDSYRGGRGRDTLLARDGLRDRRLDCGAGRPESVRRDGLDPKPISC